MKLPPLIQALQKTPIFSAMRLLMMVLLRTLQALENPRAIWPPARVMQGLARASRSLAEVTLMSEKIDAYFLRCDQDRPYRGDIGAIENSLKALQSYVGSLI